MEEEGGDGLDAQAAVEVAGELRHLLQQHQQAEPAGGGPDGPEALAAFRAELQGISRATLLAYIHQVCDEQLAAIVTDKLDALLALERRVLAAALPAAAGGAEAEAEDEAASIDIDDEAADPATARLLREAVADYPEDDDPLEDEEGGGEGAPRPKRSAVQRRLRREAEALLGVKGLGTRGRRRPPGPALIKRLRALGSSSAHTKAAEAWFTRSDFAAMLALWDNNPVPSPREDLWYGVLRAEDLATPRLRALLSVESALFALATFVNGPFDDMALAGDSPGSLFTVPGTLYGFLRCSLNDYFADLLPAGAAIPGQPGPAALLRLLRLVDELVLDFNRGHVLRLPLLEAAVPPTLSVVALLRLYLEDVIDARAVHRPRAVFACRHPPLPPPPPGHPPLPLRQCDPRRAWSVEPVEQTRTLRVEEAADPDAVGLSAVLAQWVRGAQWAGAAAPLRCPTCGRGMALCDLTFGPLGREQPRELLVFEAATAGAMARADLEPRLTLTSVVNGVARPHTFQLLVALEADEAAGETRTLVYHPDIAATEFLVYPERLAGPGPEDARFVPIFAFYARTDALTRPLGMDDAQREAARGLFRARLASAAERRLNPVAAMAMAQIAAAAARAHATEPRLPNAPEAGKGKEKD